MGPNSVDAATINPVDLRCDDVVDPFSIDHAHTRMSWNLKATKENTFGHKQTAYRILVSTSESALGKRVGDMWDSDWVVSPLSLHIQCEGGNLHLDRTCYWTVMVKDEKGKPSTWAPISKWTTDLFSNAEWIGASDVYDPKLPESNIYDSWFRKNFSLSQKTENLLFMWFLWGFMDSTRMKNRRSSAGSSCDKP